MAGPSRRNNPAVRAPRGTPARDFPRLLAAALGKRGALLTAGSTEAVRLFGGLSDGIDGLYIDRYGPGCVLILYEGHTPHDLAARRVAEELLAATSGLGVRAVYLKPFARDRSHLGGQAPEILTDPAPMAGEPLEEAILVKEHGCTLEVRLYDGFSTGLFIDQRDNRRFLAGLVRRRAGRERSRSPGAEPGGPRVLNTFAYTCAFSVACALAGAQTTSVDISPKYLDWGKRNFEHNHLDPAGHRFARMDTFEFFNYARRKKLAYDLIILDPPSFSAANKRKKIPAWSSTEDYARLVHEAAGLLAPGGAIFASTNTRELCLPGRFDREIEKGVGGVGGVGGRPRYIELPPPPVDFARERDRFTARMFTLDR